MSAFNGSPATRGVGNAPRRQYITTAAFNADFYQYTTTRNPQTYVVSGALSAVTGATAANCPANRILRENAGRLYPDANPGISTLMVGVYDEITGLKGFIDPNAPIFAVYNTDKSYQTPDGVNPNGGATDQGPPLFTRGSVTAGTTILAGTLIGYGGSAYSGVTAVAQGSGTGKSTAVSANGPVLDITMDATVLNAATIVTFVLTNTSISATDTIVVTHQSGGTIGAYTVNGRATAASTASITVRNSTAGNLTESPVLRVLVINS
jgi:hypothetical protein